jgi:hypothetical protein
VLWHLASGLTDHDKDYCIQTFRDVYIFFSKQVIKMFVTVSGSYLIVFELQYVVEYVLRNLDAIKLKERGRIFRDSFLSKVCVHNIVLLLSVFGAFVTSYMPVDYHDFGYWIV